MKPSIRQPPSLYTQCIRCLWGHYSSCPGPHSAVTRVDIRITPLVFRECLLLCTCVTRREMTLPCPWPWKSPQRGLGISQRRADDVLPAMPHVALPCRAMHPPERRGGRCSCLGSERWPFLHVDQLTLCISLPTEPYLTRHFSPHL